VALFFCVVAAAKAVAVFRLVVSRTLETVVIQYMNCAMMMMILSLSLLRNNQLLLAIGKSNQSPSLPRLEDKDFFFVDVP